MFATTIVVTGAGHEQRNVNWAEARGCWDVGTGLKNQQHLDALIAFFRARKGKAYGFRFKDWTDFRATGQLLGTGDDATTIFQSVTADFEFDVPVRFDTDHMALTIETYKLHRWGYARIWVTGGQAAALVDCLRASTPSMTVR